MFQVARDEAKTLLARGAKSAALGGTGSGTLGSAGDKLLGTLQSVSLSEDVRKALAEALEGVSGKWSNSSSRGDHMIWLEPSILDSNSCTALAAVLEMFERFRTGVFPFFLSPWPAHPILALAPPPFFIIYLYHLLILHGATRPLSPTPHTCTGAGAHSRTHREEGGKGGVPKEVQGSRSGCMKNVMSKGAQKQLSWLRWSEPCDVE
jgi:hypothetical protein